MLNKIEVSVEADEALLSVYSNSKEHSGEIKSCSQDLCLYKILGFRHIMWSWNKIKKQS